MLQAGYDRDFHLHIDNWASQWFWLDIENWSHANMQINI